jgi:hypothetical protein
MQRSFVGCTQRSALGNPRVKMGFLLTTSRIGVSFAYFNISALLAARNRGSFGCSGQRGLVYAGGGCKAEDGRQKAIAACQKYDFSWCNLCILSLYISFWSVLECRKDPYAPLFAFRHRTRVNATDN